MRGSLVSARAAAAIVLAASAARAQGPVAPAPAPVAPAPAPVVAAPAPAVTAPAPAVTAVPDSGISTGLRVGWAFPIGALTKGDRMGSNFDGMIPVWLDAGYRLSRQVYVGAYFQWAAVFVADDVCPSNLSCSANDIRFGANIHWHFKSAIKGGGWAGKFDPWVGFGTGYESVITHLSIPSGANSHQTNYGFEFGNLQLGGDYLEGPWHVGAFTSLSLAQYMRRTNTVPTGSEGFNIPDAAFHLWLMFGLRGQYDL